MQTSWQEIEQIALQQKLGAQWVPLIHDQRFSNLPFQSYATLDRISKIIDFQAIQTTQQIDNSQNTFQSVESKGKSMKSKQNQKQQTMQSTLARSLQQSKLQAQLNKGVQLTQQQQLLWTQLQSIKMYQQRKQVKEQNIEIRPEWDIVAELSKQIFDKSFYNPKGVEDVKLIGKIAKFNDTFNFINHKDEVLLQDFQSNTSFYVVHTQDDIIIEGLHKKFTEKDQQSTKENEEQQQFSYVYSTDLIISTIMSIVRSIYGWDIVVEKLGDHLIMDQGKTQINHLTVSENANEAPEDLEGAKKSINGRELTTKEATSINLNFSQQVLLKDQIMEGVQNEQNFRVEEEQQQKNMEAAYMGYKYRIWDLGNIKLVVRCEIDGWTEIDGQKELLKVKALNEFEGATKWRSKIRDGQIGNLITEDLRNNACKISKWIMQSQIAGIDNVKLGFISRKNIKQNTAHSILGTRTFKLKDLIQYLNLNTQNCWGILRHVIETLLKQDDGKYLIVKEPNKISLKIYKLSEDIDQDINY